MSRGDWREALAFGFVWACGLAVGAAMAGGNLTWQPYAAVWVVVVIYNAIRQ